VTPDIRPEEILAAARLPGAAFVPRHGWSNRTWIGDALVVRVSSGRLEDSLAHESRVIDLVSPSGVPVAPVVACGRLAHLPGRAAEPGEWLISRRLPGDTLAALWCEIDHADRARVGRELGGTIRRLHGIQVEDVAPAWWRNAHRPPFLRNAYRPLVALGPTLVEAARQLPGADQGVLDAAAALLAERLALFSADAEVLVHGDLHGHNILINAEPTPVIAGLLDWEGARCGPRDLELDMILRWVSAAADFPERPGAPSRIEPGD
jgi:hygromycin-B 7''-O-kinase